MAASRPSRRWLGRDGLLGSFATSRVSPPVCLIVATAVLIGLICPVRLAMSVVSDVRSEASAGVSEAGLLPRPLSCCVFDLIWALIVAISLTSVEALLVRA